MINTALFREVFFSISARTHSLYTIPVLVASRSFSSYQVVSEISSWIDIFTTFLIGKIVVRS